MKKHVVTIRFHYPSQDPKFPWRFAYFESMVLPRLLKQKNKDFDIAIRCNPAHAAMFRALSDRIITFGVTPEAEHRIKSGYEAKAKKYFVDFVSWQDVVGLDKYHIQTAIDSDDLILHENYINIIEQHFEGLKIPAHLSFQPHIFHVPTLRGYRCPVQYGPTKGSAFYSIFHPIPDGYRFVYDDSHLKMPGYFPTRMFIGPGHCAFSVHDKNASTYLYSKAQPIIF